MTSIDIFWRNETTFTTVQDVDTIEAALAKFGQGKTLSDVERYETIPDGQITQFGMMFQD